MASTSASKQCAIAALHGINLLTSGDLNALSTRLRVLRSNETFRNAEKRLSLDVLHASHSFAVLGSLCVALYYMFSVSQKKLYVKEIELQTTTRMGRQ
jgi:hypothetical protein